MPSPLFAAKWAILTSTSPPGLKKHAISPSSVSIKSSSPRPGPAGSTSDNISRHLDAVGLLSGSSRRALSATAQPLPFFKYSTPSTTPLGSTVPLRTPISHLPRSYSAASSWDLKLDMSLSSLAKSNT